MKHTKPFVIMFVAILCIFPASLSSIAGNPYSAYYDTANDKVFWFLLISDLHVGTVGDQDSDYLEQVITEVKETIKPEFIVALGDLTDSTNGSGDIPNGPYEEEWQEYRQILDFYGIDENIYYDIPGNHDQYDHYTDEGLSYYKTYSIQGSVTSQTQVSWTKDFDFGEGFIRKYHFLGICTAGKDGAPFSVLPADNYGDHAGLDSGELDFIEQVLINNDDAELTFIFGHHPIIERSEPGNFTETALQEGDQEFIELMDSYGVSMYGYGHSHIYREEFFTQDMNGDGVLYLDIASLGKSAGNHYAIIAVDCNGISVKPATVNVWPVVMITAPLDRTLGISDNPYAYEVPQTDSNPLRVIVFDVNPITDVQYQINGAGDWYPMYQVDETSIWEAMWDNTGGVKTITVRAVGSTTQTDSISLIPKEVSDSGGDSGGCFIDTAMKA